MTSQADLNIPSKIENHLKKKNVSFSIQPNNPNTERAEVCLLEDEQGVVQVFTASNSLVELTKVEEATGRKLKPMSLLKINAFKKKFDIESIPAVEDLLKATTIIDKALFDRDKINLHSGNLNTLITLEDKQQIRQLDTTLIADVATALPEESANYELSLFDHDQNEINNAVTKFTALRIRQRIEETLEIPPLPDSAQAIIRLRVDPNASIEKLSQIVERDPSLAAQVVSWASSSYYSAPGSIKSVQDAIVRVLGFDLVMNLALGLSLGSTMDLPEEKDDGTIPYWGQSVYMAACIGALTSAIPKEFRPSFGLSYLSGLLHNFGYLILAHSFKPHFEVINDLVALNRHLSHGNIEKHILGITREQMASNLLHSWNLPGEVTIGIRYQQDPHYLGSHCDQAHLIYLANHLLEKYELLPKSSKPFDKTVYEHLNLDPEKVTPLMEQIQNNQKELNIIAAALNVTN